MNTQSLDQHAGQMFRMEDRVGPHHKNSNTNNIPTVLPSLFRQQPPPVPQALHQHGGLFLSHFSLSGGGAAAAARVLTAQQLYMALLHIQMAASAAASHAHNHNSSSSSSSSSSSTTTTATTTTTSSAILLPPGALSSRRAAPLSQAVGSSPKASLSAAKRNINHGHRSLAGKIGYGARKHTTTTSTTLHSATPASSSQASSPKRGKTRGRVCAECRTDSTLQWRLGPDGPASLCNACGQRFQRRKQAMAHNINNNNGNQHKSEPHSPVTSSSPVSSPPSHRRHQHHQHHHIKPEPVESPTHTGGTSGERRSDIYSLLN